MSIKIVIACAVIIAVVLLICLIPIFMGASQKRNAVKPSELFPPKGASPIDVLIGYYGRLADPRKIFNPLMLYWAARGFISIEEDGKRGLKLTKLKDIEKRDVFNYTTYEIEKSLFERIFNNKRKVFYTLAASNGFGDFFTKTMDGIREEAKQIASGKVKGFTVLTNILPFAMLFFVSLLVGLSTANVAVVAMLFPAFAMLFAKLIPTADNAPEKGSTMSYFMTVFLVVFGSIPFFATVWLLPWEAGVILGVAIVGALLILFLINKKIDLRTPAQLKTYGMICGFKRFLLLAERAKLEALVEDDPEYFYVILPYCYILGITEKLKKKFDRILMEGEGWYLGELRDILMP